MGDRTVTRASKTSLEIIGPGRVKIHTDSIRMKKLQFQRFQRLQRFKKTAKLASSVQKFQKVRPRDSKKFRAFKAFRVMFQSTSEDRRNIGPKTNVARAPVA